MTRNAHLPLTETTYYILLVLCRPLHGYAAMQQIAKISDEQVQVAPGTMYGAIENLVKLRWIKEVPSADKRRRVYQTTDRGTEILQLETTRLRQLTALAAKSGF